MLPTPSWLRFRKWRGQTREEANKNNEDARWSEQRGEEFDSDNNNDNIANQIGNRNINNNNKSLIVGGTTTARKRQANYKKAAEQQKHNPSLRSPSQAHSSSLIDLNTKEEPIEKSGRTTTTLKQNEASRTRLPNSQEKDQGETKGTRSNRNLPSMRRAIAGLFQRALSPISTSSQTTTISAKATSASCASIDLKGHNKRPNQQENLMNKTTNRPKSPLKFNFKRKGQQELSVQNNNSLPLHQQQAPSACSSIKGSANKVRDLHEQQDKQANKTKNQQLEQVSYTRKEASCVQQKAFLCFLLAGHFLHFLLSACSFSK